LDDAHQVAVVDMGILVDVIDTLGIERAGAALDAVDDVAFGQSKNSAK
jgi:hypothetical protein